MLSVVIALTAFNAVSLGANTYMFFTSKKNVKTIADSAAESATAASLYAQAASKFAEAAHLSAQEVPVLDKRAVCSRCKRTAVKYRIVEGKAVCYTCSKE